MTDSERMQPRLDQPQADRRRMVVFTGILIPTGHMEMSARHLHRVTPGHVTHVSPSR